MLKLKADVRMQNNMIQGTDKINDTMQAINLVWETRYFPKFIILLGPTFLSSSFTTHSVCFLLTFIILVASSLVTLSAFFCLALASPGGLIHAFSTIWFSNSVILTE